MQFLLQLLSSAAEAGQAAALLGMEERGTLTLGTELKPPPKKKPKTNQTIKPQTSITKINILMWLFPKWKFLCKKPPQDKISKVQI